MAKLVTKFRYYKPGGRKKIGGYAKYIALREGVEKCDDSKKYAPVSYNQKQLIQKILKDFPDSKEMLEYEDYLSHPTVGNASEFISRAIEDNASEAMQKKTYADYIATRPGVEKIGTHGLFSDEFESINLSQVSDELNAHEGNVWTMIVSLRREDAERLSFNNANAWRKLCRAHTKELADALRIPQNKLKWYAAFHNQSHHPHIHLIAYTDDPKVGYLSKKGVEALRSALGNHIFHDEMTHIFREQTDRRDQLKKDWKALLDEILQKISENKYSNPEAEQKLLLLSDKLSRTKGKKVYGYLKKDVKDLIDSIVDLLAEDENISRLYDLWYGYATNETEEMLPLPLVLAHNICREIDIQKREHRLRGVMPDGKAQVTVEYANGKAKRIKTVVVSVQHSWKKPIKELEDEILNDVLPVALSVFPADENTEILINPSGCFNIGGPEADTGLTGRKIMVDTYGGLAAHGGGAFSGKDATKVDRSGAYMARYIAKNLVATGLADRCQVGISYAIGKAEPLAVSVESFGTSSLSDEELAEIVTKVFDLRPAAIIERFDLKKPIFKKTSAYGHFNSADFPWEKTDMMDYLKGKGRFNY